MTTPTVKKPLLPPYPTAAAAASPSPSSTLPLPLLPPVTRQKIHVLDPAKRDVSRGGVAQRQDRAQGGGSFVPVLVISHVHDRAKQNMSTDWRQTTASSGWCAGRGQALFLHVLAICMCMTPLLSKET